jgi:hypothetical protein
MVEHGGDQMRVCDSERLPVGPTDPLSGSRVAVPGTAIGYLLYVDRSVQMLCNILPPGWEK